MTSILLARTASGRPRTSISEAETAVFSTFFRSTSARRKKRPMYSKPQFFLGFFILRNVRASAENVQNRSASASDCVWRRERGLRASWELSQRILERLCDGLGAVFDVLAALGPPGTSPDQLWGAILASRSRPGRVRARPRNGFGRPNRPKIDFSFILGGF